MRRFLVPVLAILVWTAPAGQGARDHAPSEGDLQQQLDINARKKASIQTELRIVKKKQRVIDAQAYTAAKKYKKTNRLLSNISQQLTAGREELKEARCSLADSESRLEQHEESLGERLELIYQRGEVGLLEILFQASSYTDLQNRLYLLDQFMAQDATLLVEYEEAYRLRTAAAREAAERLEYIESLKEHAASNHARAVKERKDTADLKQRILQQRLVWERALAELEQNSREVEALLQRLQTTKTGRERLSQPFTGKFLRPVEGRITSGFGKRMHPIFKVRKMHTGVDIAAPNRTRIRAAAAGLVIHSGRWGGYGKSVLIDHGGGIATFYAHCSSLAVSAGEQVEQGRVIGRVGSTGISTGPHLHFEVRRNGKPIDPQIR